MAKKRKARKMGKRKSPRDIAKKSLDSMLANQGFVPGDFYSYAKRLMGCDGMAYVEIAVRNMGEAELVPENIFFIRARYTGPWKSHNKDAGDFFRMVEQQTGVSFYNPRAYEDYAMVLYSSNVKGSNDKDITVLVTVKQGQDL